MQHSLKITLLIIGTALITAFLTFLLLSKPITQPVQDVVLFERKAECQKLGEQYYKKDKIDAEETTVFDEYSIGTPVYAYSSKLNTCIYVNTSLSYTSSLDEYRERKYIIDLMSSKDIDHSVYATKKGEYVDKYSHGLTEEEFDNYVTSIFK